MPSIDRVATRKREGRRAILVFLILGGLGAWGLYHVHAFERALNSLAGEDDGSTPASDSASTGNGTVLPDTIFVRPSYRVATYVDTSKRIGYEAQAPFAENQQTTAEVDYITPVASFVFNVDGTSPLHDRQVVHTGDSTYIHGELASDSWVRIPRDTSMDELAQVDYLPMYQDVVTSAVRASATNVTATNEVMFGIPVTTYQFDAPWTALPEFAENGSVDASQPVELREAHVTLSVDPDGLIRVSDYQFVEQAWIDAAAAASEDFFWYVHVRVEVTSTSLAPSTVVAPESFVEG